MVPTLHVTHLAGFDFQSDVLQVGDNLERQRAVLILCIVSKPDLAGGREVLWLG